jgi:hypothetical protein
MGGGHRRTDRGWNGLLREKRQGKGNGQEEGQQQSKNKYKPDGGKGLRDWKRSHNQHGNTPVATSADNSQGQTPEPTYYDRKGVRFDHLSHGQGYGFEKRDIASMDSHTVDRLARMSEAAKLSQQTLHDKVSVNGRSFYVEANPAGVIGLARLKWETFGRSMQEDMSAGREIYGRTDEPVQVFMFKQWDGTVPTRPSLETEAERGPRYGDFAGAYDTTRREMEMTTLEERDRN